MNELRYLNKYLIRCTTAKGKFEYLRGTTWTEFESNRSFSQFWDILGSSVEEEISYSYYYGPVHRPMKHSRDFNT